MRFLAAFLVLITHCGFYVHERLDSDFEYWRRGSSGVGLFFVISGFVMILSSQKLLLCANGWKTFALRRLSRIVPIYWMATTAKVIAMLVAAHHVLHAEFDLPFIIRSYFFVPSYNPLDRTIQPILGVGWTLVFEMFFYILFTLALFWKLRPIKFIGIIILFVSAGSVFREAMLSMERFPVFYFLLDTVMLNFLFGMVLGELYQRKRLLGPTTALFAVVLGMLSIVFDVFSIAGGPVPSIISIGLASFFVLWGCASIEQSRRLTIPVIFVFLGAASYSTYLFHPLLAPIVPVLFKKLGLENPWLAVLCSILFALSATSLIYQYVERPITRFLASKV
ncbi:hypothetical protein CCR97_18440 [Rhodoplanes elegans]|uniref:Acyltransferase 3 domain-containing protein n=2 Tax=Rhodoplanes elegans TaxID=29408 RepID=A0A327KYK5_9BRAD|nr:hypothetical protein [Rhodoplanes elegans]RAI42252.1 hypothetical protein CH338_00410 [Rhodoplanes elegans]